MRASTSQQSSAKDSRPVKNERPGWVGLIALLLIVPCFPTAADTYNYRVCPKLSAQEAEKPIHVRVVRVLDGDTVDVRKTAESDTVKPYRIRLAEIDAPETSQPYGKDSTALLSTLVLGHTIDLYYIECDGRRRIVGSLMIGTLYVNAEMVKRGAAWFYSEYSDSAALYDLENRARDAKFGLWALPKAQTIEPWIWRKMSAEEHDAIRASAPVVQPVVVPASASDHDAAPQSFTCGAKTYCREMTSCQEALFHLQKCGLTRLDGDGDGIPCEDLCR
jgi:endonuclease YncB( thermonuclease family)